MILTTEQRKVGMKYHIMSILSQDIMHNRYTELQQLYESLGLRDNKKIVEKLSTERNVPLPFTLNIYNDMLLVIADYINEDPDVVELFEKLYTKRYPHVKEAFLKMEKQYKENQSIYLNRKTYIDGQCELHLLYYFIYKSEVFQEPDKVFNGFSFPNDSEKLNYCFYLPDKDLIDQCLNFTSECDDDVHPIDLKENQSVINSTFFRRYLNKRRITLAEYLGIEESKLSSYIHSQMKAQIGSDGLAGIRYGKVGTIETFTRNIIADNGGDRFWFNQMTGTYEKDEYFQGLNYVPDVDRLIENYYKSYVTSRYIEEKSKNNAFTKLTLSRECIPPSVETDYQLILCMYEMDVIYKMFSIMLKQYYQDFSWEKITNQDLSERYEKIIGDLKKIIDDKQKQIGLLSQKNDVLSLQIMTDNSKQTGALVAESNKLLKQLEEKDTEINRLREKIKYQEDFICELSKPEIVTNIKPSYDLEVLQSKRFLFVGSISDFCIELKHKFPNSLFMETNAFSLTGIEVDAVIMLIKWMSHSMFYKVKSAGNLDKTKIVMCNTKNIDTILQKIYDEL